MMKLGILIPTLVQRFEYLQRLMDILHIQLLHWPNVIVLTNSDSGEKTIGEKRNLLQLQAIDAGCTHRVFIDDDDTVSSNYLALHMPGVNGNYDCNSLVGIYSVDGKVNPKKHLFYHSIKYDHWWEDKNGYYRSPNHLNVCSLAKIGHIWFEDKNFGEDGCWSEEVVKQGCLRSEYVVEEPCYNYLARSNKSY